MGKTTARKQMAEPPRDHRPRDQGTNSRHNQEATYLGRAGPPPNVRGVWPNKGPLPAYRAPQDENSDSTRVSSKRQRDRDPNYLTRCMQG
ncbi:hypothetical protein CK203_065659 [Vitis vinifera]|uniref:Uncharacterized protein n=1 Tax=Vitis vinifera TaxID=29760 RepID=A0A438FNL8_VITVI|nr:hypothetical protein CK203_065659 [Vitis vinifera]